jgi:hypothetical protein
LADEKEMSVMVTFNVPARVPERQPEQPESTTARQVVWRETKKPTRFIIKVGGMIPF